jgi:hypothetical protein
MDSSFPSLYAPVEETIYEFVGPRHDVVFGRNDGVVARFDIVVGHYEFVVALFDVVAADYDIRIEATESK